jgi:hypothetical protein
MVLTHLMCEGQLVAQRDAVPGNGEFPAPSWRAGELIRDQFALQLPAELPAGACQLQVGIYNPESGQRYRPVGLEGHPMSSSSGFLWSTLTRPSDQDST